jgi:hypothetical protein
MTDFDTTRLEDLVEETRRRIARIEGIAEEARLIDQTDDEDADEAFARRARSGELGRDWLVLQGRIDLGETSREAVLNGEDDSIEAVAVREESRARIATLADAERERAEREGEPDPIAELERDRERLLARGAALRLRMTELLDGRTTGEA